MYSEGVNDVLLATAVFDIYIHSIATKRLEAHVKLPFRIVTISFGTILKSNLYRTVLCKSYFFIKANQYACITKIKLVSKTNQLTVL